MLFWHRAFRCAAGARDGVFPQLAFPLRPASHLFLTFFPWLEAHRSGEGDESRARAFGAFIGAQRRPLTRLPRSVQSPAKKWEISRCAFFSTSSPALTSGCSTATWRRAFSSSCSAFNRFAHANRKLLCSTLSGVTCQKYSRREAPEPCHISTESPVHTVKPKETTNSSRP